MFTIKQHAGVGLRRCCIALGIVFSAISAAAPTIPPAPEFPAPDPNLDYFYPHQFDPLQVALKRQLAFEINQRQNIQLQALAKTVNQGAAESMGRLTIEADNFSQIYRQDPVTQGRIWSRENNSGDGSGVFNEIGDGSATFTPTKASYSQTAELKFETITLAEDGSSIIDPHIIALRRTLNEWIDFTRNNPAVDTSIRADVIDYYAEISEAIGGDNQGVMLFVASEQKEINGKLELVPQAMALSQMEEGSAHISWVVSNPYALLERSARPAGTIGNVGEPIMDYALRQLGRAKGVKKITITAANNRVDRFMRSRGLKHC